MSQHLTKFQEGAIRRKLVGGDQFRPNRRRRDDALGTLTALVGHFSRKSRETDEAYDTLAGLLKNYAGIAAANYEKETGHQPPAPS